jgi:hypothetical protein
MVGAGRFVKLLKVIIGRTRLVLEVALSSGNKLLIRVIGLLVIAARIAAGSDCNLLGSSLWPPLIAFGAPLHALADCLKGAPLDRRWGPHSCCLGQKWLRLPPCQRRA